MWIVDTTAVPARYCSPSSVSTPVQRPSSISRRATRRPQWMVLPRSSRYPVIAAVRLADPPTGMDQLRCWRPKVCWYGSTPEPGVSTGWNTW